MALHLRVNPQPAFICDEFVNIGVLLRRDRFTFPEAIEDRLEDLKKLEKLRDITRNAQSTGELVRVPAKFVRTTPRVLYYWRSIGVWYEVY